MLTQRQLAAPVDYCWLTLKGIRVLSALTVEMKLVRMYGRLPDGFRVILIALVALRKRSTGSS